MASEYLHFRLARGLRGPIENAFQEEQEKIERLLPGAEVLHTGATSAAALTRGDLDIHARISANDFSQARDKLTFVYTSYRADLWSAGFATFVASNASIATGIALTAVGSEHDGRFVMAWDRLKRNPRLLEGYNAVKLKYEGSADVESYEAEKSAFFSALAQARTDSPDLLDGDAPPAGT